MGTMREPVYGTMEVKETRELAKVSFEYIDRDIADIERSFVRLGFHLAECEDMKYYEDFGFDNFYEFVKENWHKEKTAVSRHINIIKRFSQKPDGVLYSMFLEDKYNDYSYSQLSEMLQMNNEQIAQIKPEMTVTAIRELKRSWKEKNKSCDVATGKKCRIDSNYICCIENIQKKHFLKRGNVEGCAGCCNYCLKKESCEYCCDYAKEKIEVATSQQEKMIEVEPEIKTEKKTYVECAAYQFYNSCKGCFYNDNAIDCPYDRTGYLEEKKEIVAEIEYREVQEDVQVPEFPILKNMEERENFILGFKDWNIWCQNELTEETYYKYDLPDGAAIVVRSYPIYLEWKKEELEGKDLFLLKSGYKHFKNCESNMTEIKSYLKDLQKK